MGISKLFKSRKSQRGAALVEYSVLIGAVVLVGLLGVSTLGHKAADLTNLMAVLLPGAHGDDNYAQSVGSLVEITNASGVIEIDGTNLTNGSARLADNASIDGIVLEDILPD